MQQTSRSDKLLLTIKAIIERIPDWSGKSFSYQPIPGGITNINYKLIVDDRSFFLSFGDSNLNKLGIDFKAKCFNNMVCAKKGLSPQIIYFSTTDNILITEFLSCSSLSPQVLQQSDFRRQLVHTLRKLHGGPRFRNEFDMSTLITRYCKIVAEKKIPLPIGSKKVLDHVNSIATALSTFRDHLVPCHNDCIPENILSDGKKIYLVDFDYSGQNDPCFELGNLCVENGFSDSQIRELVDAYFDGVSNQTLSRTCLHGLLSDIGWSLWAFIQSSFSKIDFDFFSYGLKRWDRAVRKIANGETNTWLAWLFHTRS